jgi:hypothetical protein
MGPAVPEYKFYFIGENGRVSGPSRPFDFPTDSAALKEAKKLAGGCDIEVWEGSRIVGYITPEDK